MTLTIEISGVVEFMRKDAEVSVVLNPYFNRVAWQKVVSKGHATSQIAQHEADVFVQTLFEKLVKLVESETKHLKSAKP